MLNKMITHKPLRLGKNDWRSRWLVLAKWDVLHRVSAIKWDDREDKIEGEGVTVCGERGDMRMPGIFSRMGLVRCPKCCELLSLPQGKGAPFNAFTDKNQNK